MRRNWSELPKKGNPKVRMSAAAKIGPTMPNIETVFATKYPSATFVRGPPAHEDLWGGVICDPVGFSQHKGECWNDVVQEVILFGDGMRERTQEILYKTPIDELLTMWHEKMSAQIASTTSAGGNASDINVAARRVANYLPAFKLRFVNHYNFLKTNSLSYDVCVAKRENIYKARNVGFLKRSYSTRFSLESAHAYSAKNDSGAPAHIQFELLSLLFFLFELPLDIVRLDYNYPMAMILDERKGTHPFYDAPMTHINALRPEHFAKHLAYIFHFQVPANYLREEADRMPKKRFFDFGEGHTACVFNCGGAQYFYDNNFGIFNINIAKDDLCKTQLIVFNGGMPLFFKNVDAFLYSNKTVEPPQLEILLLQTTRLAIFHQARNKWVTADDKMLNSLIKAKVPFMFVESIAAIVPGDYASIPLVDISTRLTKDQELEAFLEKLDSYEGELTGDWGNIDAPTVALAATGGAGASAAESAAAAAAGAAAAEAPAAAAPGSAGGGRRRKTRHGRRFDRRTDHRTDHRTDRRTDRRRTRRSRRHFK